MLTLISDGVMYAGIGAVLNLGWNWESVCEFLEDNWKDENTSGRMTAALLGACEDLYMRKPGTTPPSPPSRRFRNKLSACIPARPGSRRTTSGRWWISSPDGLKIVCGGSSANLVARVLGREVTTDLSYDDDLPPSPISRGSTSSPRGPHHPAGQCHCETGAAKPRRRGEPGSSWMRRMARP